MQWREKPDDATRGIQLAIEGPAKIRLERRGNWITLWAGTEGGPLQEMVSTQVNLGDPVYLGLAVCSHDDQATLAAAFTGVTLEAPPAAPARKR